MAFWESTVEAVTESGLGVGALVVGGTLLAWPLIRPALRETTKLAIKGGIGAYQWASEVYAEAQESMGDLVAEARQERGGSSPGSSSKPYRPKPDATPTSPSTSPG